MDLRVFTEPQQGATYDQLLAVAKVAEERGFSAFFRSDHYLAMGGASGLPAYTDAWTTLAGLARDTNTIRLGTLVTPVTFRAVGSFPVIVSQVDHMSGGRVEVGLGAGWYEEEHRDYGLAFPPTKTRYDMLEDQLRILHGAWSTPAGEIFELAGKTCSVRLSPGPLQPAQHPHPPVIIGGGGGPRNSALAAAYADEFDAPFVAPGVAAKAFDAVRGACEKRDRDPATLVLSTANVVCCGRSEAELTRRAKAIGRELPELRENGFTGSPAEVLDKIGTYAAKGAERVYLQFLDLSDFDHLHLVAEAVMAHV